MPNSAMFTLLLAAGALAPGAALGQRPVELAMRGGPQPHFVAAWAPEKEREADRSAVLAGRVSLELADVSLDEALKRLTNEAGLNITYSPAVLPAGKRVTIKAGDIAVITALTEMLFRSGLDVVVDQDGMLALVACKHSVLRAELQDSGAIVGTVTDKVTGAPIAGASVMIERLRLGSTTGTEGMYRLEGVVEGTHRVGVSYIGYAPQTASVVVAGDEEVRADFRLEKSTQKLDELVTITPGGIQTQLRALPAAVTIVSAETIELQHPHTLNDIFRQVVPSAVGYDLPGQPSTTSFSLRGASSLEAGSGTVKFFVDGVESASRLTNPVDPASIERVEVLRGPQAATVYGPDAAGGVIQIFTKRGIGEQGRPEITAQAEAGLQQTPYEGFKGVGRQSYRATVRGGTRDATYNFGVTYWRLADWLPAGELSSQSSPSIFGGVSYASGIVSVDFSGRYLATNNGLAFNPLFLGSGFTPFSRPQFSRQKFTNQTVGARLSVSPFSWWRNQVVVGSDQSILEGDQIRPRQTTPADTFLSVQNSNSSKLSIGYNTSFAWSPASMLSATLVAGVDHYRAPATQTFVPQSFNTDGTIRVPAGGTLSVSRTVITNTGYFAQFELGVYNKLFLTSGLRFDDNSTYGPDLGAQAAPRIGVAYIHELGQVTLKGRTTFGRAIRAPRAGLAFGLVTPTSIRLANPLLRPERQWGWEAGLDLVFGDRASLSLTGYDQVAQDLILSVDVGTNPVPTSQFQNIGRVKNQGIEVDASLSLTNHLQIWAQYGYVDSRIENLGPNFVGDDRVGDAPLRVPAHTAGGGVTVTPWQGTTLTGGFTYIGSFREYDQLSRLRCFGQTGPCRPTSRDYIVDYPGFTKISAAFDQKLTERIQGFVTVDNFTDNLAFEGSNTLPVKGRLTSLGLRFRY